MRFLHLTVYLFFFSGSFRVLLLQSQVGFASKKGSLSTAALLLPSVAFVKLSKMESLPGVLAKLAEKFDATAFLWLLLQG